MIFTFRSARPCIFHILQGDLVGSVSPRYLARYIEQMRESNNGFLYIDDGEAPFQAQCMPAVDLLEIQSDGVVIWP